MPLFKVTYQKSRRQLKKSRLGIVSIITNGVKNQKRDQALADFNQAIALDKEWPAAYVHRAAIYGDTGRWAQAASDYRTAIQVAPDFGLAYQQSAWLMATCPDAKFRDPTLALDAAKRAIELDGDADFHYLDTLSAAYAANGKFDEAIAGIKKALTTLPAGYEAFKPELESRLALYGEKKPYIETRTPPATAPTATTPAATTTPAKQ